MLGVGEATSTVAPPRIGVGARLLRQLALNPVAGSLFTLLLFCAIFSATTHTFLTPNNLSLIVQQSVIVGALAVGETLVILSAGIDLANGAICVLGTIVAGKLVDAGYPALPCLLAAVALCTAVGAVAGLLVSRLKPAALHRHAGAARHRHRRHPADLAGRRLSGDGRPAGLERQLDPHRFRTDHLRHHHPGRACTCWSGTC